MNECSKPLIKHSLTQRHKLGDPVTAHSAPQPHQILKICQFTNGKFIQFRKFNL